MKARLGLLLLLAALCEGCSGPSCEKACEKALVTCRLDFLQPDLDTDTQVGACTQACSADMNYNVAEPNAVGWVACVEDFDCVPADEGIPLCLTCQSGYYMGQRGSAVAACQTADDVSEQNLE